MSPKQITKYEDAIEYIHSLASPLPEFHQPGMHLKRITKFLKFIGNPQDSYPSIHIGGTAGKGSTTYLISKILIEHGLQVGTHMSPHFVKLNEKFQTNLTDISDEKLINLTNWFKTEYKRFQKETKDFLTYYEAIISMVFKYFENERVDIAIIEVALGGKLDATNVLNSEIAILNSVGLDHTKILGDTEEEICNDKMQIMKPNKTFITGVHQPNLVKMIKKHANKLNNKLLILEKDFKYEIKETSIKGSSFNYKNSKLNTQNIKLNLFGEYQVHNASLAITAAYEYLETKKMKFDIKKVKIALQKSFYKGRFHIIQNIPLIIFDGAHNELKMNKMVDSLIKIDELKKKSFKLLIAIKDGKDAKQMIDKLESLSLKKIYITEFTKNYYEELKSYPTHILKEYFDKKNKIIEIPDPQEAYKQFKLELKINEIGLVTGSLYLLGKIYETM